MLDGDISFVRFQDVDYKIAAVVSGPEAQPLPLPCKHHCWQSKDVQYLQFVVLFKKIMLLVNIILPTVFFLFSL